MPQAGERFDRAESGVSYKPSSRAFDPREIVIETGWNARNMTAKDTREHIAALKVSIMGRVNADPPLPGLFLPIKVRYDYKTGTITLVDGECRLRACRELWDEGNQIYVPSVVAEGDTAQLIAATMTANSGLPLTQWEIGVQCNKLMIGFGWSVKMIAAHIVKPVRYVNEAIALAGAPKEAKSMMAAKEVTPGRVLHELKEHKGNPDAAVQVLKEAVAAQPKPPEPKQTSIPGTTKPVKVKPVARPKAPSVKEQVLKSMEAPKRELGKALQLAVKLARQVIENDVTFEEMEALAKEVLKAAGEKL